MSTDIFEYVDDHGRTHRVRSLHDVPQKHVQSMLVIGGKERSAAPARTAAPPKVDPRLSKFLDAARRIDPNIAIPLVLALAWFKARTFLLRTAVVAVAALWGFHLLYGWFENSPYSQPGEKEAPKPEAQAD